MNGDPTRIRTWDLLLRRQLLYPAELWDRYIILTAICPGMLLNFFCFRCPHSIRISVLQMPTQHPHSCASDAHTASAFLCFRCPHSIRISVLQMPTQHPHCATGLMRPGPFAAISEIIGVSAVPVFAPVFFHNLVGNAIAFAISNGFFFTVKF